jgi:hypothetical protein
VVSFDQDGCCTGQSKTVLTLAGVFVHVKWPEHQRQYEDLTLIISRLPSAFMAICPWFGAGRSAEQRTVARQRASSLELHQANVE